MTVAVTPRYQNFLGNGTTGPFSFSFPVLLNNYGVPYIVVTKIDASGVNTVLNYPADYSFAPIKLGKQGGIITTTNSIPNDGSRLFVEAETPLDQGVEYANQGDFFPETHEGSYDKIHYIVQESARKNGTALRIPTTDVTGTTVVLPPAAARANTTLGFDGSGNILCGSVSTVIVSTDMIPVVQAPTIADARDELGLGSAATQASTAFDAAGAAAGAAAAVQIALAGNTPVGVVFPYAGASAPTGFLFCYGQAVSRTTYSALFAAIGTTYGVGDGSTTFNLPDLRGRVIAGQDDMGGTSANRLTGLSGGIDGDVLGGVGGEEAHTLTVAEMPSHTHSIKMPNAGFTDQYSDNSYGVSGGSNSSIVNNSNMINTNGSNGAHNNVQPTIVLNYIIKH